MKEIYYVERNNFYFNKKVKRKCDIDEVEIEPLTLGLCGSDLHKFLKQSPNKDYLLTHVLGHEISGKVTNIGDNVTNIKIGDIVVVNPFNIPDTLKLCESFSLCDEEIDIVGRNIEGGYSELIYLPKNCVYKLSSSISTDEAIFIDDISVAYHGIHYLKEYKSVFNDVAVIGDGPLGILCYRVLKVLYPQINVILFARNQEKIKNLNINFENYDRINLYKNKFDVILEAVGGQQSDTLNKSILIGKNNCIILCYGVYNFNYMAELDIRTLFYKQGMLKGINSYCNKNKDFENAISLLSSKKLLVTDLITNRINFDDSVEFIKNYASIKNNIKTIFEVNRK